MKIDHKAPIAGLRPAVLKRIFSREAFTAATFAKTTGVAPGDGPAKLQELADLGWVRQDGPIWWVTTDLGARLAATLLIPPISVKRARELLEKAVAAAEAVNADGTHFHIVQRLVLFGSLLDAPADGEVGDVDLAVELGRREPDPDKNRPLLEAELAGAPSSYSGLKWYLWPAERVHRRLRVGRSLSLHPMGDLVAIGAVGRQVYEWDAGQGVVTLSWAIAGTAAALLAPAASSLNPATKR